LKFEHLDFVFVSDFDIRISDLLVLSKRHSCQAKYYKKYYFLPALIKLNPLIDRQADSTGRM